MITTLRSTFTRLHAPMLSSEEAAYVASSQAFLGTDFGPAEIVRLIVVRRAVAAGFYSDGEEEWS